MSNMGGKMVSIISISGGVGKTTTVWNLSYLLAQRSLKVLAVDFDQSALLTFVSGFDPSKVIGTCFIPMEYEVYIPENIGTHDIISHTEFGYDLLPSKGCGLKNDRDMKQLAIRNMFKEINK